MKKALVALAAAAASVAGAINISAPASAKTSATDYSRAGYGYVSVGAADFLERVLGQEISAAEREYLGEHSGFALNYNDKVAGKYVKSEFLQLTGALTVTPSPFSYEAVNGRTVIWQPASVNGEKFDGQWNTVISDDYGKDSVTVTYNTSFSVAYGEINNLLNAYYNASKAASEKLAYKRSEYERNYADYLEKRDKYLQYQVDLAQYIEDLAAYNAYLKEYSEWSVNDRLYQKYLEEYATYEREQKEFEEYQKAQAEYLEKETLYRQYLADKANYDRLYAEYVEKINDPRIAKELSHVEILDYIFTPVVINGNNPRTLYNAVMGNSVTQVLSRLNEVTDSALALAKLVRKPITDAERATKNLRDIFAKLNDCKTDEDKYILYISVYSSLKENLNILLQALDYCYRNEFVRSQIQGYEGANRELQYQVMLAQLYNVCNALDNGTIGSYYKEHMDLYEQRNNKDKLYDFDSTYRIAGKTPAQYLGGVTLVDTNDAEPIDGYVPIPEEPVQPEAVEKPVQPQRVPQPVAPDAVANPGPAPDVVKDPGPEPDVVEDPPVPVAYRPTADEIKLAEDYEGGSVLHRTELSANYIYYATCEVEHYFRNAQTLNVEFYLSIEDNTPEWSEEDVQAGSSVEYGGRTPEMTRRGYTCEFAGWQTADGQRVDINALPASSGYLKLYPYFTETANTYPVIWIVNGVEYRADAVYGTIPAYNDTYEGTPSKPDDADGRQYRFTGWDSEIKVMSDSAVYYTAQFEKSYLITFKVNSDAYVISVWKGQVPEYPYEQPRKQSDSRYYYVFGGWNNEPVAAQKDTTYTAQFEKHAILDLGSSAAEIELRDGAYYADCRIATIKSFDISLLAELAAQNGVGITLRISTYTIAFSVDEAYMLHQSGGGTLLSSLIQTGITGSGYCSYKYSVDLTGSGNAAYDGTFTITANGYIDPVNSRLYRIDGDQSVETRYTYSGTAITFSMRAGYVYEIYPQYAVNILASEVEVTASTALATENQIIALTVGQPPVGKFIERVYVLDSNGNEVEISSEDDTFIMPEGDVSIGVVCGFIEYTITFKADGVVIATRTYHYGDQIVAPNPVKAPDGEYSYTFVGWDREISTVTGDAEYNAIFSAEPLPAPDQAPLSKKMQILIWMVNHFVLLIVIAAAVLILIVMGIILLVLRRKKKKKTNEFRQ